MNPSILKFHLKYLICIFCIGWTNIIQTRDCQNPEFDSYYKKLRGYIKSHQPIAAISYADSVLQILEKNGLNSCPKTYWIIFERAEAFEHNKKFEDAILIYHGIMRKSEKENWWDLLAQANISIARCYETINRPTECLHHLSLARTLIAKENLDTIYAHFCARYSSYHRLYDNKDSAIMYANLSIQLGHQFKVARSVYDGHLLMGILSTKLDSAIFHFSQAVKIFEENEDYYGAAYQSLNISLRLLKVGNLTEADKELEHAYLNINKTEKENRSHFQLLSKFYDIKRTVFEKQGNIDSAYSYLQKAQHYNQKAEWYVNQENITANAIEFAIEKEKEKTRYLEKISSLMKWGLSIMGMFLLVFIILLFNNHKNKLEIKKQSELIQSRNQLLEQSLHKQSLLLSEVHHRVKNNLQLVISLLTLKVNQSKSSELKQFSEEVSSKVRGISLIHEQLYSTGDFEQIDLKEYLNNLIKQFREFYPSENTFGYQLEMDSVYLNLETVMPIGIICSELIGNSLKYARIPGKKLWINIELKLIEDKFAFKYADNGPGIPDNIVQKDKANMGLVLIKSMVRQLQAESSIFNQEGAIFRMNFVEKKISKV
ncbi:MAG: sensor histidine kinase [Saprospiraceae bacterium]|nr:sensor histidine kinase [Saprospiraceae bacterium]